MRIVIFYLFLLHSLRIYANSLTTEESLQSANEITETRVTPVCESTTCHEHATCSVNETETLCVCNEGYTGDGYNCSVADPCETVTCHAKAVCVLDGPYPLCQCLNGFVGDGFNCIENPCSLDSCLNNGVCIPLLNGSEGFSCQCQPPFVGDRCQCRNDWCDIFQDQCGDLMCESLCLTYACRCNNTGFTIDLQKKTCVDIDECEAFDVCDQPHQICKNSFGSYKCECEIGFKINPNNTQCEDVDECESSPCDPNAVCTNTHGSYFCTCYNGYQKIGGKCEDIDECAEMLDNCQHDCVNTEGGFNCTCKEEFQLTNGNRCIYEGNGTCSKNCQHGICYNDSCDCFRGYYFNNETGFCEDIDECKEDSSCSNFSYCENLPGSYQCICQRGYHFVGKECLDIDECDDSFACGPFAFCTNYPGGYNCTCLEGYLLNAGKCEEIDHCEMELGHDVCARINAKCTNQKDGYTCSCKTGFIWEDGECRSATVTLSGMISLSKTFKNSLQDKNSNDYKTLESNIIRALSIATQQVPSEIQITGFRFGSVICYFTIMLRTNVTAEEFNKMLFAACHPLSSHQHVCLLSSKIALMNRESLLQSMSYFNACSIYSVDQYCPRDITVCRDLGWGNYDCNCKDGLRLLSQKDKIPLCIDVDECSRDVCPQNTKCLNYYGSYTCECEAGYMLKEGHCEGICQDNPCLNDGVCVWHGWHDYRCLCPEEYHGDVCQVKNKRVSDLMVTLYIVSASLGALVVFTCVGAAIWQTRFQKKQLALMYSTYEADAVDTRVKAESTEMLNPGNTSSGWRL